MPFSSRVFYIHELARLPCLRCCWSLLLSDWRFRFWGRNKRFGIHNSFPVYYLLLQCQATEMLYYCCSWCRLGYVCISSSWCGFLRLILNTKSWILNREVWRGFECVKTCLLFFTFMRTNLDLKEDNLGSVWKHPVFKKLVYENWGGSKHISLWLSL